MKVTVTFDTAELFKPENLEAVDAYFRREIPAVQAARRIGFTRDQWRDHMAAIFAQGNSKIETEKE